METVSRELSISTATLERWRADALSRPARERAWTAPARFEAVLVTAAMDEASKSAWCRENGVYPQSSSNGARRPHRRWPTPKTRRAPATGNRRPTGVASRTSSATCAARRRPWPKPPRCWCCQKSSR
ncbi:transposition helper protein [Aromatoleum aromaticum EbN1]|uniref:Transposition helper protein n=1 Tax=Aromatoleum aromaticum (strain DSM 19018 / LMG 30748 / EbN1) TaxID=76114 RepID=Q5P3V2_AROAE|nr:transposition helper protein [Aromatoleum aromaticum EbN1]